MITYGKRNGSLVTIGNISEEEFKAIAPLYDVMWQFVNLEPRTIVEVVIHMGMHNIPLWRLETIIEGYRITKPEFFSQARSLGINLGESIQDGEPAYTGIIVRPDKRFVSTTRSYILSAVEVLRKFQAENTGF